MTENKTDILIIGGGIAGCIAAISLVESYNVTIIDKLSQPKEKIGESLTPASNRILKELNLLNDLEKEISSTYINNIGMQSFWGSPNVLIVDHLRNPDGYVKNLNRKAFEKFLRKSAEERGVQCIWNTKLFKSTFDITWTVQVKSNNINSTPYNISAKYVIDASGRQSHFARSQSIQREVNDKLIACWVSLPNYLENTMSTISASKNGWWYSAVTPNNNRVLAYHTDSDLVDKNELKNIQSIQNLAQENKEIFKLINTKEADIKFHGTVAANSTKLNKAIGNHWAAIGDAAMSFDPLSSQGMFNAMACAMQLKTLIQQLGFSHNLEKKYSHQINNIWQHYINHKLYFYKTERRWLTSEFWDRRQ